MNAGSVKLASPSPPEDEAVGAGVAVAAVPSDEPGATAGVGAGVTGTSGTTGAEAGAGVGACSKQNVCQGPARQFNDQVTRHTAAEDSASDCARMACMMRSSSVMSTSKPPEVGPAPGTFG
jgi:hypothetical protein